MSARAVKAWTWARKIRDSGPASRDFLCAMLTLHTFMNANGFTRTGLRTWAKAARMSVNTLRKHVATAERLGWLSTEALQRAGTKAWKCQQYRAAVPEGTDLSEIDQKLSDALLAEHGEVERRVSAMDDTPYDVEEAETCVTHADTPSEAERVSPMDDTPQPSNIDHGVSNQSLMVCQTEADGVSKSPFTCVTQGDTVVTNRSNKTEVTRHQRKGLANAKPWVDESRETETDAQRSHRISKLIQALPNDTDHQIAKALSVTAEEVSAVRRQCLESINTTALPRSA
jgi:hypothetical protein